MLIVLLGKTCSGKTTIAKEFEKEGFRKVVTCTTRPKRVSEKDGTDYNFLDQAVFDEMKRNGEFAETAEYVMANDQKVSYGSLKKDFEGDETKILVLTPSGLKTIRESGLPVFAVYVKTDNETIKKRLKMRGDDPEEAIRRLAADDDVFKDAEKLSDFVVNGKKTPECNVERITKAFNMLNEAREK